MILSCHDLFPIDGKREPPTEEEISGTIEHLFTLYERGFCSKEEFLESMSDMVRHAELFAYAKGRDFGIAYAKELNAGK